MRSSQRRLVPFPLPLQLFHKRDEIWITADVIEIRVAREVGIARPAALCCLVQPVDGALRLAKQRVDRCDVVGGMMKVDKTPSFYYGGPDVRFGPPSVTRLGEQDRPRTRHDAATVFRVVAQVSLHQLRRLRIPAEVQERPCNLVVPE